MIFKLHYCFQTPAAFTLNLLLRLFILNYSDATNLEVRILFTVMPFVAALGRIFVCSWTDRRLTHREGLIGCLASMLIGYLPIIVIPLLGPSVYLKRARLCFYIFAVAKVLIEVGLGASVSVGDSLANNYARLYKEDYNIYRIWGLFSWLLLAAVITIGDEIQVVPRYVPAFMLLALFSLLHMTLIWRWPRRDCVLLAAICLQKSAKKQQPSIAPKIIIYDPQMVITSIEQQRVITRSVYQERDLDARTQIRITRLLTRLDPRVYLHLAYFVCMGLILSPFDFFFRDLATIFHHKTEEQYDKQFGMFLAVIAFTAAIAYFHVHMSRRALGRVGMFTLFTFFASLRYLFYGLNWTRVTVFNAIGAEFVGGIMSAIYVSTTVESGDVFASEVELMIPKLVDLGIIEQAHSYEKVKLALAATTGAMVSMACDGFGRGFGSLIYNLALDVYTYGDISLVVGICSVVLTLILLIINYADHRYNFKLGLDTKKPRQDSFSEVKC